MPRKARDYAAEYRARVARGEARGLSRKQARGHAGDRLKRGPRTLASSPRALDVGQVPGYLAKLRAGRSVKVVATLESGRRVRLAEGRAAGVQAYLAERIEAEDDFADQGPSTVDGVVAVQVFYS